MNTDKAKIIRVFFIPLVIVYASVCLGSSIINQSSSVPYQAFRMIRGKTPRSSISDIIPFGQSLKIGGNIITFNDKESLEYLNYSMINFVRGISGAEIIFSVSDPIPYYGATSERLVTYRFDIETNMGEVSIYVKWIEDDIEGERFEKASDLGIASRSEYGLFGWVISEHFEGEQLVDLFNDLARMESAESNIWLFEELGRLLAILDKNHIGYNDWVRFNILVNTQDERIAIIDFENAQAKTTNGHNIFVRDIMEPFAQVIELIQTSPHLSKEAKSRLTDIINTSYSQEMENP